MEDMMYVLNGIEAEEVTADGMDMRALYREAKRVAFNDNASTLNDEHTNSLMNAPTN
jgi:hypothetical protein